MQETFHQYTLITALAKKYSHSTYLASPINDPEQHIVLIAFDSSLSFASPRESEGVLQKAQSIKDLQHPHLLLPILVGIAEELPFVVRDYLPNLSLRSHLNRIFPQRLELSTALTIVLQVGEALAYAHTHNIPHGNVKPENILFDANGQALLTDFTLVSEASTIFRNQITAEYAFHYIAPEQFVGIWDGHSDQYALGCLAYELITGKHPFAARTMASIMGQHTNAQPIPLSKSIPNLPTGLDDAVLKTLAKEPDQRFFHLSPFLEVIRSALSQQPASPFLHSFTSQEQRPISYHTHPPKEQTFLSSPDRIVASANALSQASETLAIPVYAESDIAQPVNASLDTIDATILPQAETEDVLDNMWITNLFDESSTAVPASPVYEQHDIATDGIVVSLPKRTDRSLFLTKLSQYDKRKFLVLALLGLVVILFVVTASGTYTTLLPLKTDKPDIHSHSVRVMLQTLLPTITSLASTQPAVQVSPSGTAQLVPQVNTTLQVVPTPTPIPTPAMLQTTIIDDSVQGTGINQFNYVGHGWYHCTNGCQGNPSDAYQGSNSWDNATNDYATISFTGVQIKFYVVVSTDQGFGAVSIDGGSETMIDCYAAKQTGDQLRWASPMLPTGSHTFKIRVTGNKNPSSSNYNVTIDRIDILG